MALIDIQISILQGQILRVGQMKRPGFIGIRSCGMRGVVITELRKS